MIDIVTVVFEQELPALQVQAQSIDLFCQNLGIKNIYVIVNDQDSLVQHIDPAWWGQFQTQVKIVSRDQFNVDWLENGWINQQVLKILSSSLSDNVWSMILDAKTMITNHMSHNQFVIDNTHLKLGLHPIADVFQESASIAGHVFDIVIDRVAAPSGVPFIFNNHLVRYMINEIENKVGCKFSDWFLKQGKLTEFILYTAFVKYRYSDLKLVYLHQPVPRMCANVCHSQTSSFDQILGSVKHERSLTMGVHRDAWSRLTLQQQEAYVAYLISLGITKAGILI